MRYDSIALKLHPVDYARHSWYLTGYFLRLVERRHAPDVSTEGDDAIPNLHVDVPEEVRRVSVECVIDLLLDQAVVVRRAHWCRVGPYNAEWHQHEKCDGGDGSKLCAGFAQFFCHRSK